MRGLHCAFDHFDYLYRPNKDLPATTLNSDLSTGIYLPIVLDKHQSKLDRLLLLDMNITMDMGMDLRLNQQLHQLTQRLQQPDQLLVELELIALWLDLLHLDHEGFCLANCLGLERGAAQAGRNSWFEGSWSM